jgi:hypothetical protein
MNITTDNSAVIAGLNKRIENLERYNLGLANESCSQQALIAELEEELTYAIEILEVRGVDYDEVRTAYLLEGVIK